MEIFSNILVKLDPFHFINRYKPKKTHALFKMFMALIRQAIFQDCTDDRERLKETLQERRLNEDQARDTLSKPSTSVRRIIPGVFTCM